MKQTWTITLKKAGANAALLLASLGLGLLCIEGILRTALPRYRYAAESSYAQDLERIWVRKPNDSYTRQHPDTGHSHSIYHNNLALRHHRDIDEESLASAVNIAFFGDSYVENLRLPVQYAFTEVLDYLLNTTGGPYNVLNAGVDGYGTDQAFLYSRDAVFAQHVKYVFYVFCANDLVNLYGNQLFSLNADGELEHHKYTTPWWIRMLSKFHTTYLLLDARNRLLQKSFNIRKHSLNEYFAEKEYSVRHLDGAEAVRQQYASGQSGPELQQMMKLFQALLRRWQHSIEARGGQFYVVLLPKEGEHQAWRFIPDGIPYIDLFEEFQHVEGAALTESLFRNDGHWNETGNQLAALSLYRFLERELGMPPITDDALKSAMSTYYAAFPGEWKPTRLRRELKASAEESARIRMKYLALEQ